MLQRRHQAKECCTGRDQGVDRLSKHGADDKLGHGLSTRNGNKLRLLCVYECAGGVP